MKVFVAKQPIVNKNGEVFAYELLYRKNEHNEFPNVDGDEATTDLIITCFFNIGIKQLSNGKPCFINFTERLLELRLPTYLPSKYIVVELVDTIQATKKMVELCEELKGLGYKIAIGSSLLKENSPYLHRLLQCVDYLKVDFLTSSNEIKEKAVEVSKNFQLTLIGEKIEAEDIYLEATESGYCYFQGYLFGTPIILSAYDVPPFPLPIYKKLKNTPIDSLDQETVTDVIMKDLSLTYKLLKFVNSPKYKVNSINEAVALAGLMDIKKWLMVMTIRNQIRKPDYLPEDKVKLYLFRAKMCEAITNLGLKTSCEKSSFLIGMFSLIDSLIGVSMDHILKDLPLDNKIVEALSGQDDKMKKVLDLLDAVEKARWSDIQDKCNKLNIDIKDLFRIYAETINWVDEYLKEEKDKLLEML